MPESIGVNATVAGITYRPPATGHRPLTAGRAPGMVPAEVSIMADVVDHLVPLAGVLASTLALALALSVIGGVA